MSDNLWINLKILSKLPPYAKLNTQHELFYIEYNSLFSFTSIKRMIRGDNRSIAIKRIDKLVKESIEVLNNDKEMSEKLGKNARNLVIEKFNWEKLAKEFVEIVKPYVKAK